MRFSASMLNTWGSCALKAKFNYLDRLPTQTGSSAHMGSCVHYGCELLHGGKSVDEALDGFLREYNSTIPDYFNRRTDFESLRIKGIEMVRAYADTLEWKKDHVFIAAEHSFMVDIGEHTLSGIVDYIEVPPQSKSVIIGDLKTGYRPNRATLHLALQFTVYDWASRQKQFWTGHPSNLEKYPPIPGGERLFEEFQHLERKLIWYDLKKQEEIDVGERGPRDYGRMYRCMEQIDRAIDKEVFVPSVSAEGCVFCDFTEICPVYFESEVDIG